ncbi:MAG: 3',5'-cyclic nucleotide phosphodiesterase [Synechococcaceae cyanobacterium SM1_2_3]|nr:3',5'-cyclic nucleotide phosphodiesterase [Synechococcaceae cyanobacterium SM1_2_3]
MKRLSRLDESKLFIQLKQAQTDNATARDQLVGHVRWVVDNAKYISDQIVRRLPQYTLHNGTHLFNVLSIMEELLPDETLRQLTPLECALCILAAFTHDLGMVMLDDEVRKYQETTGTPENQEWLRHCDAYPEEQRQIKRWQNIRDSEPTRKVEAGRRVGYLEGHLLAEFIRKRHADRLDPIQHWLTRLEDEAKNQALFCYGNFNFKRYLAQIGVSHGQRVSWLREILTAGGKQDSFCRIVDGERVNLAFPGLLVRLADIMDFDASRAPGILYKHFGIENAVSILEWNKHMAMTGWGFDDDTLTYEADGCGHPVYEKSIRGFVNAIKREVEGVSEELNWQQRLLGNKGNNYQLRLLDSSNLGYRPPSITKASPFTFSTIFNLNWISTKSSNC